MLIAIPPVFDPTLLNHYPCLRSQDVHEASEHMGRVFSPHRLALCTAGGRLDVRHNRVALGRLAISVLRYGADVVIDSDQRADFYMVQLPLSGCARVWYGNDGVVADSSVMSILQPGARSRMEWQGDCAMILVQLPRSVLGALGMSAQPGGLPHFAPVRSRHDAGVAAWWQAVEDLVRNLDRFGSHWLRNGAAVLAVEEFLLASFVALLRQPGEPAQESRELRRFREATDYVRRHLDRALSSAEIAGHLGISTRQLELLFKQCGEIAPVAYARRCRLQAVRDSLLAARREGRQRSVTEVALDFGFGHMGRFAKQYRAEFGHSPSAER